MLKHTIYIGNKLYLIIFIYNFNEFLLLPRLFPEPEFIDFFPAWLTYKINYYLKILGFDII